MAATCVTQSRETSWETCNDAHILTQNMQTPLNSINIFVSWLGHKGFPSRIIYPKTFCGSKILFDV